MRSVPSGSFPVCDWLAERYASRSTTAIVSGCQAKTPGIQAGIAGSNAKLCGGGTTSYSDVIGIRQRPQLSSHLNYSSGDVFSGASTSSPPAFPPNLSSLTYTH